MRFSIDYGISKLKSYWDALFKAHKGRGDSFFMHIGERVHNAYF